MLHFLSFSSDSYVFISFRLQFQQLREETIQRVPLVSRVGVGEERSHGLSGAGVLKQASDSRMRKKCGHHVVKRLFTTDFVFYTQAHLTVDAMAHDTHGNKVAEGCNKINGSM